jgi:hypothetical protein
MAFLYIGSTGKPWRKHSYSAGMTFDQSPLKYYLQKILGWKEKDNKARFALGKAFENSIQWYHEHNGEGATERFRQEWEIYKENKLLKYTAVEKDWENCLKIGVDWTKLYALRQPCLPIPLGGQTLFQREFSKEMFLGDPNYGEIEFAGKLDIVSHVDPVHPMLPKLIWKPEYGAFRPIIVDIKTSGMDFPEAYGLAAYDYQLRSYSFLSGIRDVALLWFVKKSPTLQKGYSVTLLKPAGNLRAGDEAVIAYIQEPVKPTKKEPDKQPPMPLGVYLVANDFMVEECEKAQGYREGTKDLDTTNEAKERKYAWLQKFGTRVEADDVTKQRLQFNAGYVTIESAQEAGQNAGRQIIDIVNAWHQKTAGNPRAYPNTFGIRFPHDDRQDPYFRAFVLEEETFKNENFIKTDEESLDDLFGDVESEA